MDTYATAPAIEFQNVSYSPGHQREILHGVSLALDRGKTTVLLGRSGSGKTTALKLVNALLAPSSGDVVVEGKPTTAWDPIRLRRHIGYVIQETGLFPHFSVERNIGLVPSLEGWEPGQVHSRVAELLRLVGLDPDMGTRYPRQLSGGQRQRVGVARALAADPPILLMDEPFGALDPITRAGLQREFLALQQRLRKTVVFVTHDVNEALLLASRIALFDAGRVAGVYTAAEFLTSGDPLVGLYLTASGRPAATPPGGAAGAKSGCS